MMMMMQGGKGGWSAQKPKANTKAGDWMCPSCGDHQLAKNEECRKCGQAKPSQDKRIGMKPGDWLCPGCKDLQFAKNVVCRQCGTPNPDPDASLQAMEAGKASGNDGATEKPGDWYCPSCGDLQFARNSECRKCGTPNPDPDAKGAGKKTGGKGKAAMKPGDWYCSSCGDLQFARNMQCRQCGAPNMQMMV